MAGTSKSPALNDVRRQPLRPSGYVRRAAVAAVGLSALFLAGCSEGDVASLKRLGLPEPASDRTPYIHDLWIGTWIAAGIIGVGVWALIGWAVARYKTNHNDMPRQTRYNLPMEIFYTLAPFIVIGVLFYYTILAQTGVQAKVANPDVLINVVGQKWSWTFNYKAADNPNVKSDVWEAGTINQTPTLYLPVNKSVRFQLSSPDVIHSFWVPAFYEKLDIIPGRQNTFDVTPNKEGTFAGKCAELCGTYHSAMLFKVAIVSQEEYDAHLRTLVAKGQTGEARGPKNADPVGTNAQFDQQKVGQK